MSFILHPKQVLRRLWATKSFTVVALITIAVGIGANSAVFGVVNGILLKPLAYPKSEQLVSVMLKAPGLNLNGGLQLSASTYFTFREQNHSFEDIGLWTPDSVGVTGLAQPEQVPALDVTDGVLPMLRTKPYLGRLFTRQDDQPNSPHTAMLSYGYWMQKTGGDRSVLGRRILINSEAHQVIGILPPGFRFLDQDASIVLPIRLERANLTLGGFNFDAFGRLRDGKTPANAQAESVHLLSVVSRSYPPPPGYSLRQFDEARIGPDFHPLKDYVVGDVSATLWIIMGTLSLVLLITCANIANLLLVRAEGRRQELAVRAALGATSLQLAFDILADSVVLGLTGGAVGLGLAFGALKLLVAIAPANLPRLADISIDTSTMLYTLAISLVAGLLFGLLPVAKFANIRLNTGLRGGGRNSSASRERHRARNGLVVVQVMLAVILLISSGLMVRTALALLQVQPGFKDPASLQTFGLYLPESLIKDSSAVVHRQQSMQQALAAIPGVRSVAIGNAVPMDGNSNFDPVFARDKTYTDRDIPLQSYRFVAPGFFDTMGARIVAGRDYDWSDIYDLHPVTIVSENLARSYWGSAQKAIGKQVRESAVGTWREVVGVVNDVHQNGMNQPAPNVVYWPLLMNNFEGDKVRVQRFVKFALRSNRAGSQALLSEASRAIWSVSTGLPISDVKTMQALISRSLARTSFTLIMLSAAAIMALLLGVVGIYGVIAYSVSQRQREIGVRMAIGAPASHILQIFVRSGLVLTMLGTVLGTLLSIGLMRVMSSVLYGVKPFDLPTYAAACLSLLLAAFLASYIPSRRALQVDPAVALRTD